MEPNDAVDEARRIANGGRIPDPPRNPRLMTDSERAERDRGIGVSLAKAILWGLLGLVMLAVGAPAVAFILGASGRIYHLVSGG